MAERYGTVPKKFTAEWWDYFWTYYKWYVIAILFLVIAIGSTIYGKITEEKFDLTVIYAGNNMYSEETSEKVEEFLSPLSPDVDENGEQNVSFMQLQLGNESADPEYAMAMNTKLQMSLAEDETYIFILSKDIADAYSGEGSDSCVFAPLDDWLEAEIDENLIFKAHNIGYGIDISGMEEFKKIGADFSNHYLFLRYYPRKDQLKRQLAGYESAVEMLNSLLSK